MFIRIHTVNTGDKKAEGKKAGGGGGGKKACYHKITVKLLVVRQTNRITPL